MNFADATDKLALRRIRLLEFKPHVLDSTDSKNQAADELSWFETGGMDTTQVHDDRPEIMVSMVEQGDGKIKR